MKKYLKKFIKTFILVILTMCLVITLNCNRSHADAGYHSSYSGGSSSHSSSSSYSSGSSHSSYSGSSYSSSSSSSGGSAFAGLIIWIVIIIIIIAINNKKQTQNTPLTKLESDPVAIAKIKQILPNFNETQFLQDGYKIFLDVEDAWMNFDLEKVRNVITDEMFNMYESQLSSMEIKGEQNIMKDFVLRDCAITECNKQNDNIEVTTKYIIEFYDYIIEKSTGKVLRGNKNRKLRMYYNFTFVMSNNDKKIDKCPNCGAPVNVNSAGICEYCGSKIIGENGDWVMSKKVCTTQVNL